MKKQIEDELTLFCKFAPTKNIIAVSGTRGKTTTTNWITHFLKLKFDIVNLGNSPENSLIGKMNQLKKKKFVVIECPSCLLEQSFRVKFAPKIAVITNIYQDHLNRYSGKMKEYALIKANIFLNQKKNDILILNYDNKWREFFLKLKPKSKILFFSLKKLPNHLNGIFVEKNNVIIRNKKEKYIFNCSEFIEKWGKHNLENILISILISDIYHISKEKILGLIKNIPSIKFRQEIVFKKKNLEIYNDTASTSPEAGISAIKRFHNRDNLILITGGTDKDLEYTEWAKIVKKYLKKQNVVFLKGSGTEKMKKKLKWRNILEFNNLKECFKKALEISKNKNSVILFSPSSKSFEKFKNEFDRGEQFNELVGGL
jgi:UDP-N-acetylmuramoylalanine--D-glutamate ligase